MAINSECFLAVDFICPESRSVSTIDFISSYFIAIQNDLYVNSKLAEELAERPTSELL